MSKKQECIPSPLSHYHPIRYASSKSHFINEAIQTLISDSGKDVNVIFSLSQNQLENSYNYFVNERIKSIRSSLSLDIYPAYLRKIHQFSNKCYLLGEKTQYQRVLDFFETFHDDDYITLRQYTSLSCNGSNIFDFSQELLELFGQTDIVSVLLKDIHLPFPTIYLHFGKQNDKKIDGNINSLIESIVSEKSSTVKRDVYFLLDGAYVSQCPNTGSLRITLTSIKNKMSKYPNNCIDCYEDTLHFILNIATSNITVGEAAELERKRLEKINNTSLTKKEKEVIFSQSTKQTLIVQNQIEIGSKVDQIIDYLKLVINCILYLQSYPEEIQEDYPHVAPPHLVNRTKYATQSGVIAQKKLNELGYRKIKFCGRTKQQFGQSERSTVDEELMLAVGVGRMVSPHKRRAHLRKQRYGKGLQQWRFVWIKETTIHRQKYQLSNCYRIYEVVGNES